MNAATGPAKTPRPPTPLDGDWKSGAVFLRVTAKKGATPFVSHHQCWHRDHFIACRAVDYGNEGGRIEVITEAEYLKEKKS